MIGAGGVHQGVDAAPPGGDVVDQALAVIGSRDVGLHDQRGGPARCDRRRGLGRGPGALSVGEGDRPAARRQRQRDLAPDSTGPTGDQRDAIHLRRL